MKRSIKIIIFLSCLALSFKIILLILNDETIESVGRLVQSEVKPNYSEKNELIKQLKLNVSSKILPLNGDDTDQVARRSQKQFGYFPLLKSSDYNDYDLATLEALGEQGDLRALDVLALKYLDLLESENAIKTYQKAAIFGSTKALVELGRSAHNVPLPSSIKNQTHSEGLMKKRLARLAYFQAGILRGDTTILLTVDAYLNVRKLELTPQEKRAVQLKGQSIFKELQVERIKLGLADFPSMPPNVQRFYLAVKDAEPQLVNGKSPLFITSL